MRKRLPTGGMVTLLLAGWIGGGQLRAQAFLPDAPSATMGQSQGISAMSGAVMDVGGTPVSGANVVLTGPTGVKRATMTDEDGEYQFDGLAGGRYTVSVRAEGLEDGSETVVVTSGVAVTAAPFALKLATVNTEVEAVGQRELAEIQIKQEEKQRILGVIPNFYVAYDANTVPLTAGQKFELADKTVLDPVTLASVALTAGLNQALKSPEEWGQNWTGYGQRFGASLAGTLVGVELEGAILPAMLHQDPRYFFKGTGTTKARVGWALKQVFEQKGDNGKWQPGYSNIIGDTAASAVTVAIYPHQDTDWGGTIAEDFALNLAGEAFGNIMQEFVVPKLHFHRKQPATP